MKGRKPIPAPFRAARSNPKRPLPFTPTGDALPECPETLDTAARAEWARVVKLLPVALLTAADLAVLSVYCQSYARWVEAETAITANGTVLILRDDKGAVRLAQVSPFVNLAHKYRDAMVKAASEIGFTPVSRVRLGNGAVEKKKPAGVMSIIARSKQA